MLVIAIEGPKQPLFVVPAKAGIQRSAGILPAIPIYYLLYATY